MQPINEEALSFVQERRAIGLLKVQADKSVEEGSKDSLLVQLQNSYIALLSTHEVTP